jgi:3-methyladenine DNA glycosylase/8-oxoguanine DNA glycosylase
MSFSSRSSKRLRLSPPPDFDFRSTVGSHGWSILPPFSCDPHWTYLERVFLTGGATVLARISSASGGLLIDASSAHTLSPDALRDLKAQVRTCFRLDEDLSPFHKEARRHRGYRWIAARKAGRLLRSPTVFEDAVKMICTTNCTWGLTTLMVTNLVQEAGDPYDDTHHAFPRPETIAGLSEAFMRKEIKAGYRSASILRLADAVASDRLAIEKWRSGELPTPALLLEMRSVHGIGPYAAGNLLRLAGRYNELALDSWVRGAYYRIHHGGRKVKDATIEKAYARYGDWRGLFFWLEMTKSWHDEKFSA